MSDSPEAEKIAYRSTLLRLQQEMQSEYDKAVLTLSGSAFAGSFLYVKEVLGSGAPMKALTLQLAWLFWGLSMLAVLASYWFSAKAMEKAVEQVDADKIFEGHAGGFFDKFTRAMNAVSGISFILGLVFFVIYVSSNT
jgi:hypothetical protein